MAKVEQADVMEAQVVLAEVRLKSAGRTGAMAGHAAATMRIAGDEQIFAGHYPAFPIFPGVCVIECVRRCLLAALEADVVELVAVERAQFLSAIFPDDEIEVTLDWERTGESWSCSAQVHTSRGKSAVVRLRCTVEG